MNFDTYTERARSVLQSAQTAALAAGHQVFLPEHILKALLEDRDRFAANLIRAAGGNAVSGRRNSSTMLLPGNSAPAGAGKQHGARATTQHHAHLVHREMCRLVRLVRHVINRWSKLSGAELVGRLRCSRSR